MKHLEAHIVIEHPRDVDHLAQAHELLSSNEPMVYKLLKATALSEAEVPEMLREVLRFLHLIAWSGKRLTPPYVLDLAWHEFILFTKAYAAYCDAAFGRFIHHTPGGTADENQRQLKATLSLYISHFGTPDPRFWGDQGFYSEAADCGACEATPE